MNGNRRSATLEDVAQQAGVSKYTVSAVLNRTNSNTRVSAETRERILAAAAALNYRPNAIALSLRRRKTDLIGLYNGFGAIDARNRFMGEMIGGLQEGCDRYGKDLVMFRLFHGQSLDYLYNALVDGKVDGLILYAPTHDELAEKLADSHLPVVAVADSLASLPSVVIDDAGGGAMQAQHLADRGHRCVLYRAASHSARSISRRREGFMTQAAACGLTVHVGYPAVPGENSVSNAERAWLTAEGPDRLTAAACWEDAHADSLMRECRSLGIRVPDDFAVIGFDGLESAREPAWHLTSIRAPWMRVTSTAVSLLMERIDGNEVPMETVLPVELVAGQTT
jgi:DNA-binding LacI/PurR family transcriptional regulator